MVVHPRAYEAISTLKADQEEAVLERLRDVLRSWQADLLLPDGVKETDVIPIPEDLMELEEATAEGVM